MGARLVCHCSARQTCHADVIIEAYRRRFPNSFDRTSDNGVTPTSSVQNYSANQAHRQMREFQDPGAGWVGKGEPMMVGSGYTSRPVCDGLSSRRQVDGLCTQGSIQQQNSRTLQEDMAQLTS